MITPSPHQLKIFDAVKNTSDNICIQATAGSGKTVSLLECLKLVPKFKRTIFLSFSNGIVNELKKRVPPGITTSTLHSLGMKTLIKRYGAMNLVEDKFFRRCLKRYYTGTKTNKDYRDCFIIQDICNFLRLTLTPLEKESVEEMCLYYGIDFTPEYIERAIELVKDRSIINNEIDFADMIYLPVALNLITEKFDYVFLDEAQDLNNAQTKLFENILAPSGRFIACGDSFQSIFSFIGSNIDSFEKLQQKPNTVTLTLPVSYRCPRTVISKAKEFCDFIEPHDNSIEGEQRTGSIEEIKEGDLVICRNTRPLITLFFQLLERDIKSVVVGKDIEKGLVQLSERCESTTIEGFEFKLDQQFAAVKNELLSIGVNAKNIVSHPSWGALEEKAQVLVLILKKCQGDVTKITPTIKTLFHEDKLAARLMTLHRSKGLENDRVFIIRSFDGEQLQPSKYAIREHELVQERNLSFVGITRAKSQLIFIDLIE